MTYDEAVALTQQGIAVRRVPWTQTRILTSFLSYVPETSDKEALDWVQVTEGSEVAEPVVEPVPVAPAPEPVPVAPAPVPEPTVVTPPPTPVPPPQPQPQPLGVTLMALHVKDIKPIQLQAKVEGIPVEVLRIMAIAVSQPDAADAIVATDNVTSFLEAKKEATGVTVTAVAKIMVNGEARAVTAVSNAVDILPERTVMDPATGAPMVHEDGTPVQVLDLAVKIVE